MTRYELIERIGVGGMAEVFRGRATAVGGFEKPVAIKKILPHLSQDNRFVSLLIAEAKLLANLRQRNIVQIYDVGLGEDGGYFLVMEYVDGHDLGALFERMEKRRERFPLDLALHIGAEVCEALEHAHRATDPQGKPLSLVHRDVSPSNVMLSKSGEVKLTDFGIAKKVDSQSVVQQIAGKFAYMSPEQANGRPVGVQSDIYSLGVVLWELLLGRRLYSGVPELEALRLVREARVPRPRELEPTFSRELETILLKALAADPQKRYASAAAFGAALRDYRYSAATAGDPAREIQMLLKRHFGDDRDELPQEQSRIVRIQTVAGFDDPSGTGSAKRLFDNFDAPTVAAPGVAAQLAADSLSITGSAPIPTGAPKAAGSQPRLKPLPSFDDSTDDAETRMLARGPGPLPGGVGMPVAPGREREATPTVRELPLGQLVEGMDATPDGVTLPPPGVPRQPAPATRPGKAARQGKATTPGKPAKSARPAKVAPGAKLMPTTARGERRLLVIVAGAAAAVLVVAVVLVIALRGGTAAPVVQPDAAPEPEPEIEISPAGEALDGPAMKAPPKKNRPKKSSATDEKKPDDKKK